MYVAGDQWKICEVCGFKTRSSQTFRRWDGVYVCEADFETRHPQDFVRGRRDRISVPAPRPETIDNVIGPLTTTISAAAAASATTVSVESSVRFLAADHISIILNDGSAKRFIIMSIPSTSSIELTEPLGGAVSIGNAVTNFSAVSSADIG
jgi:hypothetical protein